MDLLFALTLTEHHILGNVFAPYLLNKKRSQDKFLIYDRVTQANLNTYEAILNPEEVQLVKTIEEYNNQELFRAFSKKKKTARDFMASITPELLEEQIRPYIERRMIRCIEILEYNPVPLFHKILQNNVYEVDRIKVLENESSAVFNFTKSGKELYYYLSIEHNGTELNLFGKEGTIIVNDPCSVIIDNKLFVFRDIDGKKLLPFFEKKYIHISPSTQKKYFETFVRNAIKKYKVNAEGFPITDLKKKPVPILSIERNLAGNFSIVLKFIYDKKSIYYANRKTELKVTCEFNNNEVLFSRLSRDYNYENQCVTSLLSMGLVNKEGATFYPLQKGKDDEGSAYTIINWVNYNRKLIENKGFSIAQNKLEKLYYLDEFEISIDVSEKNNDWFDIEARVEFAGFNIPFASFHTNILNGNREYQLPDGRIMILPEEWFESYRDIMSFAHVERDQIKLSKQHFSLLNKNILGISTSFKKGLLDLAANDLEQMPVPDGITATLRKYQVEGFSWLYHLSKNRFGACLADDMGLGKTLQTLTLLVQMMRESTGHTNIPAGSADPDPTQQLSLFDPHPTNNKRIPATSLIVVPTSLVHNWINEINRFAGDLRIYAYIGAGRKNLSELFNRNDIILTSYGIVRNEIQDFASRKFFYVILDESQMIKNPGSKTYQAVIQLHAENRIVLTGTPIENSLTDMWAQINFLNPGLLGSLQFFRSEFQLPVERNNDETKKEKLLKLISPFVLRRTKSEVAPELPSLTEQTVYCDMDEMQQMYYEREKSKARNLVIERTFKMGYHKSAFVILQSLTKLRQIANHPALIDDMYFADSGKYTEIKRNLQSLLNEGNKALIFSSFVKHLELIRNYLDNQKVHYAWLTGDTKNREQEIHKFQKNKQCPFFLVSLKAGGVGLNLTAADYVFLLDPWWNPAAEMQAVSRAHRIGQDKHVFVYRFISRNTLEEKIINLQEQKSNLADAFINNSLKGISQEQVMELFE